MSLKSLKELEYHLLRLHEAAYLSRTKYLRLDAKATNVRRQLYSFTQSVRRRGDKREQ